MKPSTAEWVDKAEGDFAILCREMRARKNPSYDGACFHAQQCAEKYLKARLQEASIPFVKTHDLLALLALTIPIEPMWSAFTPELTNLRVYAVRYRYPGDSADRVEAKLALKQCRFIRKAIRQSLALSN
jgi:HEPN domain-containing protein